MGASESEMLPSGHVLAGRFRVESELGRGGFGAVFRATQLNLGRSVAVKVLLPELVHDKDTRARFEREARLAQRLSHPNTVRVLDFGQSSEGLTFIVFEMLEGKPLDVALREGPMEWRRVARIGAQALKSLMEAHSVGIVHRDIKPSNIFLCAYEGERDFVKVLDFGIAKNLNAKGASAAPLTQGGFVVGTPGYMAPEHVAGMEATATADLYALGIVLCEALTGRPLFEDASPIDVCMSQLSPQPLPFPEAVRASPLWPVIERATRKTPDQRYASAGAMLAELERISSVAHALSLPQSGSSDVSEQPQNLPSRGSVAVTPQDTRHSAAPLRPSHQPSAGPAALAHTVASPSDQAAMRGSSPSGGTYSAGDARLMSASPVYGPAGYAAPAHPSAPLSPYGHAPGFQRSSLAPTPASSEGRLSAGAIVALALAFGFALMFVVACGALTMCAHTVQSSSQSAP